MTNGQPNPDYIESSLWGLIVPIDALRGMKNNPRKHGSESVEAVKASLKIFKQQKPVVISADGEVIAGNGTLEAAIALGWEYLAASKSSLTAEEAQAYAVADNRTQEKSEFDFDIVRDIFKSIDGVLDKTSTAFTEDEIAGIMGVALPPEVQITEDGRAIVQPATNDPNEHWVGMPEFSQENRQSKRKIIVHFDSDEAVADFFEKIGQSFTPKTRSIWHPEQEWHDTESKRYGTDGEDHPETEPSGD